MIKEAFSPAEKIEQFEFAEEELIELAQKFGLKTEIPDEYSSAFKRLTNLCRLYAERVDYQFKSDKLKVDGRARGDSDKIRRELHNKLCIMLLGRQRHDLPQAERDKVSNFAVTVGKKEEYVGTF